MEERVFELGDDPIIKIKYKGEGYELSYPSALQMSEMVRIEQKIKQGEADYGDAFKVIIKQLVDLGMPKNVVSKLSYKQVTDLLAFIYDKEQKKS